jgi:hypothetical protein
MVRSYHERQVYIEDVWQVGVRVRPDERGVVGKEEVERCVTA